MKQGTVIAGKFLLEQKLADGGMGSVWVARHLQLNTHLAIKFMAPQLADAAQLRARFEREAQASALLQSPHVVRVFDYGYNDGVPYIAMELLRGETLGARIKRERRIPVDRLAVIVKQCAKGLRKAHEAGIVHRDLKPQNIFLAADDDDEVVKILDFGIAKVLGSDANETTTGSLLGSPLYMSPEQVRRGREADHRTDLWSLGVVTYRALTGHLPFTGTETGDIIVKICTDSVPPPSSLAPDLPAELDAFFVTALARDPALRFQSALDFARAFTEIAERAPPPQEPTGRPSWSKGTIPMAMPMRPSTPAFVVPSPLPSTPTLAHTPSGLSAMTPPPQALTVAPDGSSGTLTNAASDTDVHRAAARAAARTRVLIAVGVVATLGAVIAALVPSAGHEGRAAASAGPESSATAPAPAPPAPTGAAPPSVSAGAAAPPEPIAAPAESATAKDEPRRDEPAKHDEPTKRDKPSKAQAAPAPPPKATSAAAPAAATPRKSKVNCDPPFTVDADGIKHAKPECS